MKTLSWNCQGLGLPWKIQFLKDVISQEKLRCIFLCETIRSKTKMEIIRLKLGFNGILVVEPMGKNGGLALLWKDIEKINLRSMSQNHVDEK